MDLVGAAPPAPKDAVQISDRGHNSGQQLRQRFAFDAPGC